jgi:hypothetical protein
MGAGGNTLPRIGDRSRDQTHRIVEGLSQLERQVRQSRAACLVARHVRRGRGYRGHDVAIHGAARARVDALLTSIAAAPHVSILRSPYAAAGAAQIAP